MRSSPCINPFRLSAGVILTLSLFTQPSLCQRRIDPAIQKVIDDFIVNAYLPAAGLQGIGLSIIQNDGELLYSTGYGFMNIEKGIPNGNSTQYGLGSIAKGITATLTVKILHEKFPDLGEAVMDIPIRKLIPEVNFTLIDRYRSEQVTFRDLLAHRTCVMDQPMMAEPFQTSEEMMYRTRYNEVICDLRTTPAYNNEMIAVAGLLAAHLVNKSYEDAMQDLWNEMGMLETAFAQRTDNFTQLPNRAMPYFMHEGEVHTFNTELLKRIKVVNGAGGIFSTPDDMVRYMRLHLNRGNIDGKQIIPEAVMKWLTTPSSAVTGYAFKNSDEDKLLSIVGYGLGFVLNSYDGWEYVEHGGFYPPYHNQFSVFPGKKLGIYTGTHMMPFSGSPYVLHAFIFDVLRGVSTDKATEKALKLMGKLEKEKAQKDEEEWKATFEKMVKRTKFQEEPVKITVGKYGSGHAGEFEISERYNEVHNQTMYFMDYGKWYKGWLIPVEGQPSLFKASWITDIVQEDILLGIPDGRDFVGVEEDDTLVLVGILGYVGRFKLGVGLDTLPVIPWDPSSCGMGAMAI